MAAPVENVGERSGIDPGGDGGGGGDADVAERLHQEKVEDDVGDQADGGDAHRRGGVLAGEEAGHQDLHQHVGGQAAGEGHQRGGGRGGVFRGERAAFEQGGDDRIGEGGEAGGGGQGEEQGELHAPVLGMLGEVFAAALDLAGEHRQQRGADGDADNAQGKLVDTVGVVEPGDRAFADQRGDHGVDQEVDLVDPHADHAGDDPAAETLHVGVQARHGNARPHAAFLVVVEQPEELHHARDRHRPGQDVARTLAAPQAAVADRGDDQAGVEQDRRGGGGGEPAEGVLDARQQRHQGDEEQVGEGDAREVAGERDLARHGGEAGGEGGNRPGHDDFHQQHHGEQHQGQPRKHGVGEALGLGLALALELAREQRHEGGGERAFGEQVAEQVGEAEGDEERVGLGSRAEHPGEQDVADEPGDAADQGETADGGDGTVKAHLAAARSARGAVSRVGSMASRSWRRICLILPSL